MQSLPAMTADAGHDPLPSWREGALKTNLLDCVESVSGPGCPDFVAPEQRIAVFDNDGTLWSEQPMDARMAFALHRARRLVAERSDLARHPQLGVPYGWLVYQPMLQLLAYLRAREFSNWIVTGGGVEFVRLFAEEIHGIPPDRVIGSTFAVALHRRERPAHPVARARGRLHQRW